MYVNRHRAPLRKKNKSMLILIEELIITMTQTNVKIDNLSQDFLNTQHNIVIIKNEITDYKITIGTLYDVNMLQIVLY